MRGTSTSAEEDWQLLLPDKYRYVEERGRKYRLDNLRRPNPRPNLTYDYKGFRPHQNGWAVSLEKMQQLDADGRLEFSRKKEGRITACRVMAKRLRDVGRLPEDDKLWRAGRGFVVRDLPWSEKQLRVIPPFEFENWESSHWGESRTRRKTETWE
jgi:hypothetical protein